MPFLGMMRVRNEERWIERAIKSLLPVCESIYVMDDNSTDRTKEITRSLGCVCLLSPFPALPHRNSPLGALDEARDKTWLLDAITSLIPKNQIGPTSPYWVLYMDGDEELVGQDTGKLLSTLSNKSAHVAHYCVQILYLWDGERTVRTDAHYLKCYRPSLFRVIQRGMTYRNMSGKIHSTGVPVEIGYSPRLHEPEPVRLLHYGYMLKEDRERHFEHYMKVDPRQEEFYWRECFGPVTTAPLESVLR